MQGDGYYLEEGEAAFEDGTVDYLNLPAVEIGLKHITNLDIEPIHERVIGLTDWLIKHLLNLYHSNGEAADSPVRPGQYRPARRHGDDQLLRSAGQV